MPGIKFHDQANVFKKKKTNNFILQLTSKGEVCSLQMLSIPGARLCLCFYRGLELFLLS